MKILTDGYAEIAVETQTHVVVVSPYGVTEGLSTVAQALTVLNDPDTYLKVVTEWICPTCGQVHGDQSTLDISGKAC